MGSLPLQPQYLANLAGRNKVAFKVNDQDTNPNDYLSAVENIALGCTDTTLPPVPVPVTIHTIPVTSSDTTHPALRVHVCGSYGGMVLDNSLLVHKKSGYLQSVQRADGWYEVNDSKIPITGAKRLNFGGSYTELGVSNLSQSNMKVGFSVLMRALCGLIKGSPSTVETRRDFLIVCVNLFEPARYFPLAFLISYSIRSSLEWPITLKAIFLIKHWKNISHSVLKYRGTNKWSFEFVFKGNDGVLVDNYITEASVPTILRMVKADAWVEES